MLLCASQKLLLCCCGSRTASLCQPHAHPRCQSWSSAMWAHALDPGLCDCSSAPPHQRAWSHCQGPTSILGPRMPSLQACLHPEPGSTPGACPPLKHPSPHAMGQPVPQTLEGALFSVSAHAPDPSFHGCSMGAHALDNSTTTATMRAPRARPRIKRKALGHDILHGKKDQQPPPLKTLAAFTVATEINSTGC